MTVRVVTDSTSDLPANTAQELGISVVPLQVNFETETYLNGVELTSEEFFQKLIRSPSLPTTTQPPAGAFAEVYGKLAQETNEIISIHISAKLSGTINSALVGKGLVEKSCRIEIIDSLQASMGVGLIVITAAKAAQAGVNLEQIMTIVNQVIPRVQTVVLADTLEYLQKGGRIGKAEALLGSILNVKPLIKVKDGEGYPLQRVRTQARAVDRLYDFVRGFSRIRDMAIMHSTTPDEAERFAQRIGSFFPREHIHIGRFGPVMGTYLGPGALGVTLIEE